MEETVREIYEKLRDEINKEDVELKCKAYGTDLRDNFAIALRDDFKVNEGKKDMLVKFYNMLMEIIKG